MNYHNAEKSYSDREHFENMKFYVQEKLHDTKDIPNSDEASQEWIIAESANDIKYLHKTGRLDSISLNYIGELITKELTSMTSVKNYKVDALTLQRKSVPNQTRSSEKDTVLLVDLFVTLLDSEAKAIPNEKGQPYTKSRKIVVVLKDIPKELKLHVEQNIEAELHHIRNQSKGEVLLTVSKDSDANDPLVSLLQEGAEERLKKAAGLLDVPKEHRNVIDFNNAANKLRHTNADQPKQSEESPKKISFAEALQQANEKIGIHAKPSSPESKQPLRPVEVSAVKQREEKQGQANAPKQKKLTKVMLSPLLPEGLNRPLKTKMDKAFGACHQSLRSMLHQAEAVAFDATLLPVSQKSDSKFAERYERYITMLVSTSMPYMRNHRGANGTIELGARKAFTRKSREYFVTMNKRLFGADYMKEHKQEFVDQWRAIEALIQNLFAMPEGKKQVLLHRWSQEHVTEVSQQETRDATPTSLDRRVSRFKPAATPDEQYNKLNRVSVAYVNGKKVAMNGPDTLSAQKQVEVAKKVAQKQQTKQQRSTESEAFLQEQEKKKQSRWFGLPKVASKLKKGLNRLRRAS